MFSKACTYGMRAVMYIAKQSDTEKKVGVKEIAVAIDSPEAFTGKVLQKLSKENIIQSTKGRYGGYFVEKERLHYTFLSDLIRIFDGENAYRGCAMGLSVCDELHPCPMHEELFPIIDKLSKCLEKSSLHDILYNDDTLKNNFLKR